MIRGRHLCMLILPVALFVIPACQPVQSKGETHATRVITDMTGRQVQIPGEVRRVVTAMYPIATQLMFLVSAQESLVGISDYDINDVMLRIYPPMKDIYRPARSSGGEISVEEIIKMKPDVVFCHIRNAREHTLKNLDIARVILRLENPEALMQGILLVGDIMNRTEQACKVVNYYRSKLDYIKRRTAGINPKKTVYFAGPAKLSTAGGDFFQNFVIEYAGGINVGREGRGGWCSISIEHLLAWNPHCIFIGNYGTASIESFTGDPRLRDISAVKKGDVYMSPYYIGSWDVPTPESVLGIMWLANILYPEAVAFDMAKEMKEFYTFCYGYTPKHDEIARVLGEK